MPFALRLWVLGLTLAPIMAGCIAKPPVSVPEFADDLPGAMRVGDIILTHLAETPSVHRPVAGAGEGVATGETAKPDVHRILPHLAALLSAPFVWKSH